MFRKRIKALPEEKRPGKVIFAILTDGLENASRRYSLEDVSKKISKRRNKDGWEFLFLGANQDAIATAAQMNIRVRDSASSAATPSQMFSSHKALSRRTSSLRAAHSGRYSAQSSADISKSMEEILSEEEDKEEGS